VRDWALAGLGIIARSEWDVAEHLHAGRLAPLLDGWHLPDADVVALISSRHGRSLRATRFLDHLYSSLSQLLWMPSVDGERAERGRPASPGS
jgi:DNA-binding transcriptional LysR family regulator